MMIKRSPTLSAMVMCMLLGAGLTSREDLNGYGYVGISTGHAQQQGMADGEEQKRAFQLMERVRHLVGDKQYGHQFSEREIRLIGETTEKLRPLGLRALPVYIESLKDKNRFIREISVDEIGFIIQRVPRPAGSEWKDDIRGFVTSPEERQLLTATFQALVKALKDPDTAVRMGGACYMSVFGDEAVPLLETALSDPAIEVRHEAYGALGMMGRRSYGLVKTLTGKEPETFDDFVALLDDTTPYGIGESAAYRIQTKFAEQAVPVLLTMITSNRGPGRVRAMQILSRMKVNEAISPIVGVLRDATTDDTMLNAQYEAVSALRRMGTGEAIKGLEMGFGGQDPRIRISMGEVLTGYGRREIVLPEMVKLLKDGDPLIRVEAARLLCKNNEPAGIPVLIDVLRIREFRGMAYDVLEEFTGQRFGYPRGVVAQEDIDRFVSQWRDWWEKNKDTFKFPQPKTAQRMAAPQESAPAAPPAVQLLIETLRSTTGEARIAAVLKLGEMGENASAAIPSLMGLLRDTTFVQNLAAEFKSTPSGAIAAGRVLEKIGKPAVAPLIDALKVNADAGIRMHIMIMGHRPL